jgi:hypothetical protein
MYRRRIDGNDYVDLELQKLVGKGRQALILSISITQLNGDVGALYVASLLEFVPECFEQAWLQVLRKDADTI